MLRLRHNFNKTLFNKTLNQGRPLSAVERKLYQPYFLPQTLHEVRIFEAQPPFWLHRDMCAVVLGRRIYFREYAYQAHSIESMELLAHELTHVEQYLAGMTIVKYLWASRYGYRQNPYEIEAYAKGAYVRNCLSAIFATNAKNQL